MIDRTSHLLGREDTSYAANEWRRFHDILSAGGALSLGNVGTRDDLEDINLSVTDQYSFRGLFGRSQGYPFMVLHFENPSDHSIPPRRVITIKIKDRTACSRFDSTIECAGSKGILRNAAARPFVNQIYGWIAHLINLRDRVSLPPSLN